MFDAELKVQGAEAVLTALFESLQEGYSIGRVTERFRELAGIQPGEVNGLLNRLHLAGGLSVNNALFDCWERLNPPQNGK